MGDGNGKEPVDRPKQRPMAVLKQNSIPIVNRKFVITLIQMYQAMEDAGYFCSLPGTTEDELDEEAVAYYLEMLYTILLVRQYVLLDEGDDDLWMKRICAFLVFRTGLECAEASHLYGMDMYLASIVGYFSPNEFIQAYLDFLPLPRILHFDCSLVGKVRFPDLVGFFQCLFTQVAFDTAFECHLQWHQPSAYLEMKFHQYIYDRLDQRCRIYSNPSRLWSVEEHIQTTRRWLPRLLRKARTFIRFLKGIKRVFFKEAEQDDLDAIRAYLVVFQAQNPAQAPRELRKLDDEAVKSVIPYIRLVVMKQPRRRRLDLINAQLCRQLKDMVRTVQAFDEPRQMFVGYDEIEDVFSVAEWS